MTSNHMVRECKIEKNWLFSYLVLAQAHLDAVRESTGDLKRGSNECLAQTCAVRHDDLELDLLTYNQTGGHLRQDIDLPVSKKRNRAAFHAWVRFVQVTS